MALIESSAPKDWRDLQTKVQQILTECGMSAEVERDLELARGSAEIDVYAEDPEPTPNAIYLCECKNWATAVPQAVVHGFRQVVIDSGANLGLIISRAGFQSGAHEAAAYSNVRLLTWEEFQHLFAERWFKRHMLPMLHSVADPLIEYTEPINSRIFRKADALAPGAKDDFIGLRKRWLPLASTYLALHGRASDLADLPLRSRFARAGKLELAKGISDAALDATALRDLLESLASEYRRAIAEFDGVFGGRA